MQLVIDIAGVVREVDVNVQVPDATVGDLLEALGCRAGDGVEGIVVDGRFLQAYLALAETGLHDGAVVRIGAGGERAPTGSVSGPVLTVVGGVDAGQRIGLCLGRTVIGRDDSCDMTLASPAVSSRHCVLDVEHPGAVIVEDLESKNGVWVGGERVRERRPVAPGEIVLVGAVQLTVLERECRDRPVLLGARRGAGGNIAFNRPPRPMPAADSSAVALPKPPRESPVKQPFSWISMLAPLAMAAVMVGFGGAAYALFALLSPVMLVGNWVEGRRRGQQTSRQEATRFATDLETFRSQLEQQRARETARTRGSYRTPPRCCAGRRHRACGCGSGEWPIPTFCACRLGWAPSSGNRRWPTRTGSASPRWPRRWPRSPRWGSPRCRWSCLTVVWWASRGSAARRWHWRGRCCVRWWCITGPLTCR